MSHNRSIHLFWFVFVFEFFLFHVCQMSIINCLSRLLCYSITKFNAAKIISIVSRSHWTQSAFIWVFSLSLSDCEFCFGSGWIRLITPTALSLSTQNSCNNLKFNFNHEYSMIFSLSLPPFPLLSVMNVVLNDIQFRPFLKFVEWSFNKAFDDHFNIFCSFLTFLCVCHGGFSFCLFACFILFTFRFYVTL